MQHVGCCLQDVMDHVTCPEIFVESEVSSFNIKTCMPLHERAE